jgi:hypothetical protein
MIPPRDRGRARLSAPVDARPTPPDRRTVASDTEERLASIRDEYRACLEGHWPLAPAPRRLKALTLGRCGRAGQRCADPPNHR